MNSSITATLAAILILMSLVKLIVVFWNPHAWLRFARRFYTNPRITSGVALAFATVILLLLIRSGLDIVQILAVSLFVACLMVVGITPYAQPLLEWFEKQDMGQLIRRQWPYTAVWIALLIWGAYSLVG